MTPLTCRRRSLACSQLAEQVSPVTGLRERERFAVMVVECSSHALSGTLEFAGMFRLRLVTLVAVLPAMADIAAAARCRPAVRA
jgi:hypothetical protein